MVKSTDIMKYVLVFAIATFIVGYKEIIKVYKRIIKVLFLNAHSKQHIVFSSHIKTQKASANELLI